MGEMADMIIDQMYDPHWDGYDDDPYDGPPMKILSCRKCGSMNVKWHQYPSGKWFLFTDGKPHKCDAQ